VLPAVAEGFALPPVADDEAPGAGLEFFPVGDELEEFPEDLEPPPPNIPPPDDWEPVEGAFGLEEDPPEGREEPPLEGRPELPPERAPPLDRAPPEEPPRRWARAPSGEQANPKAAISRVERNSDMTATFDRDPSVVGIGPRPASTEAMTGAPGTPNCSQQQPFQPNPVVRPIPACLAEALARSRSTFQVDVVGCSSSNSHSPEWDESTPSRIAGDNQPAECGEIPPREAFRPRPGESTAGEGQWREASRVTSTRRVDRLSGSISFAGRDGVGDGKPGPETFVPSHVMMEESCLTLTISWRD